MSDPKPITDRTFEFAVRIVNLCKVLDETPGATRTLSKQLIRSGTSIGANVEEAQSAQSLADFINKMEVALKEARETKYWRSTINCFRNDVRKPEAPITRRSQ